MRETRKQKALCTLVILLLVSVTLPVISADPPPGSPEVTNTICDDIPGTGFPYPDATICDDWDWTDDDTPGSTWVESEYAIEMNSLTEFTLDMEFAIHEFNRTAIGLDSVNLGGNSTTSDGMPADYIRNYFPLPSDPANPSGPTVKDTMLTEFGNVVETALTAAFGTSTGISVEYRQSIDVAGAPITCTDDPELDSADEDASLPEDAYNPPICMRVVLTVESDSSNYGLGQGQEDNERLARGLLTMGTRIDTNFTLVAEQGHLVSYDLTPPPYANFEVLDDTGVEVQRFENLFEYNAGLWVIDNRDATDGDGSEETEADIRVSRRETTTKTVQLGPDDEAMSIEIEIDASDDSAAVATLSLSVNHLDASMLSTWGIQPFDSGVDMPWITSDGIRMLQENGYVDMNDLVDIMPIDDFANSFTSMMDTPVTFSEVAFSPPDATGGLDFTHVPQVTCAELSPTGFCVEGQHAMNGTYPIRLATTSSEMDLGIIDLAARLLDVSDSNGDPLNVSFIGNEDLALLMNVLSVEKEINPDMIGDFIPETIPPADITIRLLLPDWLRSTSDSPEMIELVYVHEGSETTDVGITGPNPWPWEHALCYETTDCTDESEDVFCLSTWRTCIRSEVDVDLSSFSIQEFSGEVEMDLEASVRIHVHRIGLPESLDDDVPYISVESIPADLIRHVIALGDDRDGGLLAGLVDAPVLPFGDTNHTLEVSDQGFQNLSIALTQFIDDSIQQLNQDIDDEMDGLNDQLKADLEAQGIPVEFNGLVIDLSGVSLVTEISPFTEIQGTELSDENPITIGASLEKTTIRIGMMEGKMFGIETISNPAQISASVMETLAGSFVDGLAVNSGMSGFAAPVYTTEVPSVGSTNGGLELKPGVEVNLGFPRGLGVGEIHSEQGNAVVETIDGRQHVTYRVPLCETEDCADSTDTLSFTLMLGYQFILIEMTPYLTALAMLIIFLMYRRHAKRAKKRAILEEEKKRARRAVIQNTQEVLLEDGLAPLPMDGDWSESGGWGEDPWAENDPAEIYMQGRMKQKIR